MVKRNLTKIWGQIRKTQLQVKRSQSKKLKVLVVGASMNFWKAYDLGFAF